MQSNSALVYTLGGALTNNGLVFSQGSLVGASSTLSNNATGGMAALGDMSLTTTGNMTNQGSLYTQGNMTLNARTDFDNSSQLSTGGESLVIQVQEKGILPLMVIISKTVVTLVEKALPQPPKTVFIMD